MSRQRKVNRGLPRRVYLTHGAYRYFSPTAIRNPKNGKQQKWIHLAYEVEGESAMLTALAALLGSNKTLEGSMPFVCAEFKATKLDAYEPETKTTYGRYLDVIAKVFDQFHTAQVTTKHCADFLRVKFKGKPNTAKKYAALMTRLFKFAIGELGLRETNPMDQIDLSDYKTSRREQLPTHEQVRLIREAGMLSKPRKDNGQQVPNPSGPMFQCIIDMTYLCCARDRRAHVEGIADRWRLDSLHPEQNAKEQRQGRGRFYHPADTRRDRSSARD